MPTGRKPCLEHVLPPGVGAGLTSRLPGWWPGRRGDEDGREGVAKRARRGCFLNLVYANLKLTRVIYA